MTGDLPLVSVVVETITAREDSSVSSLADDLAGTLAAAEKQSYPRERFEIVVVLDEQIDAQTAAGLQKRYPTVRFARSEAANYFGAKNAGARASNGEIVALLDGDCMPETGWLHSLVSRFDDGVDVVSGRTRYVGKSIVARTFSVPDFANVLGDESGNASGFNINNVAFRREVLLSHPLNARIRRNGGCYLLYHQLRAIGTRIVYEPRAVVNHGLDIAGLGFIQKHFDRGYDGLSVYRFDESRALRGTRLIRRFGILALPPLAVRRIALDWVRLVRERRQIGISLLVVPYWAAVAVVTRLIELAGGIMAGLRTPGTRET